MVVVRVCGLVFVEGHRECEHCAKHHQREDHGEHHFIQGSRQDLPVLGVVGRFGHVQGVSGGAADARNAVIRVVAGGHAARVMRR